MSSENNHRPSDVAWNIWKSYTAAKSIVVDPKTISKNELSNVLKKFYVEVRKTDGSQYKKSSLTTFRFGLQRKFKEMRVELDTYKIQLENSPFCKFSDSMV